MRPLRLLVAEGNTLEARSRMAAQSGELPSEGYAAALRATVPDARIDLCFPADPDPKLPAPLEAYDGIAITGSALNIYKGEPASTRQVDSPAPIACSSGPTGCPSKGSWVGTPRVMETWRRCFKNRR